MLVHYEIYETIINDQYELQKAVILNDGKIIEEEKYSLHGTGGGGEIYFPNGGEVKYTVPNYYVAAVQYLAPPETEEVIDEYLRGQLPTLEGLAALLAASIAAFKNKALGWINFVVSGSVYLSSLFYAGLIDEIENGSGACQFIGIQTNHGESVTWTAWQSYSQITTILSDATNVTIIRY
ncbi:hypothetical protein [Desulfitibacter alkalitolerans]|uniref:hypothetical protein n=1 Tax=Desulfitibacter alkalitolerans TaxID=264641 RepID=UPI000484DDCD|nr:hypothetical protein [Desulfitibacter alkalitolerans]